MKSLAHIRGEPFAEQTLREHCLRTAQYAGEALESIGLRNTAYLAGLLHDCGKAKKSFVEYLEKSFRGERVVRGSVNHTFAGVIFIFEQYADRNETAERLAKELIAYAIGAHHGLFDLNFAREKEKSGFEHRLRVNRKEIDYEESKKNFLEQVVSEQEIDKYFEKAVDEVKIILQRCKGNSDIEPSEALGFEARWGLLARLLVSAVMEGDRRDTAEFMLNVSVERKVGSESLWERELNHFHQRLAQFTQQSPINLVRSEISEACEQFAKNPPNIYRMNLPTGAGKTFASLRYALAHAKVYRKKRIIFIIPLLSILNQNEKEIRESLTDEKLVFAHHSNMIMDEPNENEEENLEKVQREYLKEAWNSEVIVSTFVQFMNMLYTDKTSAIRRMNALVNSVIVIDEVQSMPSKLYKLFMTAIDFLREFCGATIILSSATQPCFDVLMEAIVREEYEDNFDDENIQAYLDEYLARFQYQNMIPLSDEQRAVFKRATVTTEIDPIGRDFDEFTQFVGEIIEKHSSTLVICNTKSEAKQLFGKLYGNSEYNLFHLSASMCAEHIDRTLNAIKEQLEQVQNGQTHQKVVCISTQLVEAGVDFSFQSVVRVLAGFDNLAQSAGRCNRGSEYGGNENANVYFVNLKDEKLGSLKFIKTAQDVARSIVLNCQQPDDRPKDWLSEKIIERYYRGLFQRENIFKDAQYIADFGDDKYSLCDLLDGNGDGIPDELEEKYILNQAFKTAAGAFEVFEDEKEDVLVPYGEGEELLADLRSDRAKYDIQWVKKLLKKAKQYTVSVYRNQKSLLNENGLLYTDENKRFYYVDKDAYNEDFGLCTERNGNGADFA